MATTCDHMPPKQIFDFKQRPRGLVFPSCDDCNARTSQDEQVISLISRIYPDGGTEAHQRELKKLLDSVSNNDPGLLPSLLTKELAAHMRLQNIGFALPPPRRHISLESPKITKAFDTFSLKLFLALHFQHTRQIIDHHGGIQYMLFTNLSAVKGHIPPVLSGLLEHPHTLVQGRKNTGAQFSYGYQVDEREGLGLYFVTFRRSFALGAIVARDTSRHDFWFSEKTLRPFSRNFQKSDNVQQAYECPEQGH